MNYGLEFELLYPKEDAGGAAEVRRLLRASNLDVEPDIQFFVVARKERRIVACAGLAGDVVKCVAIAAECRGTSLSLKLMNEVQQVASIERGHNHLFLYTKPENAVLFEGCGFHQVVSVLGSACLMENTPVGIRDYCDMLAAFRQPGERIGGIVVNANPFTLGHRHLVQQALGACDWLHVFVVSEDASAISYADRLDLVRAGLAGLDRVTVHAGSRYLVSKATFPSYFLKDAKVVEACSTALDLLIFRRYISPALGITHRFVGNEPFCAVTRKYNRDMHEWLEHASEEGPALRVVEIPRLEVGGIPVSASRVRQLLGEGDFEMMAHLVPATTLALMRAKYAGRARARTFRRETRIIEVK